MSNYNCHVRIHVPYDSNGIIRNNSTKGHYDLQIDGLNGTNLVFDGRSFSNPVFSYGGDSSNNGIVQLASASVANSMLSNVYLCRFDFTASDSNVYDFIMNKLYGTYLNTTNETVSNNVVSYKVKTGPFKTYNVASTNCFTAVANWCNWLGYSYLLNIANNASSYTDYLAWKMYDQYHSAWSITQY